MTTAGDLYIRSRTPDDDARAVEIQCLVNHDRPPLSLEEFRHFTVSLPPDAHFGMVVAERAGQIVGYARWSRQTHLKAQDAWWGIIYVDPNVWGQGIGGALYEAVMTELRPHDVGTIRTNIREDLDRAHQFCEARGFMLTGRADRVSRLNVKTARLERCRAAAERMESEGIRIATLAELGAGDALLHAVHRLDDETARDIPSSSEWDSMPFDQWRREMLDAPGSRPDTFWVALDGETPVGLALLEMRQGNIADNAYTATDRRYRGKGIARALKYHTVRWAQEHDIDSIITGNDVDNTPMLTINIDLGYQPLPASVERMKIMPGREQAS